jgi:hypothetical protein
MPPRRKSAVPDKYRSIVKYGSYGLLGTYALLKLARRRSQRGRAMASNRAYQLMRSIYYNGYQPPDWVQERGDELLQKYATMAMVLYPAGANLTEVTLLAEQREPVNIAMQRMYDQERLQVVFGYMRAPYDRLSGNGAKLPPQIAVACVTPIRHGGQEREVAVVNIIGMAFDSRSQPDYRYFHRDGSLDRAGLYRAMVQAYLLAFQAVRELPGRDTLCASPVGNVAFRPEEMTQLEFEEGYVWKAVSEAHTMFPDIKVLRAVYPDFQVPQSFFDPNSTWSKDMHKRVYVNAWDCWSALGNGNALDSSSDGWWGRSSAISLLGWPLFNTSMRYVAAPRPQLQAGPA